MYHCAEQNLLLLKLLEKKGKETICLKQNSIVLFVPRRVTRIRIFGTLNESSRLVQGRQLQLINPARSGAGVAAP